MILLPFGKVMDTTFTEGLLFLRLFLRADGPA